ncbi:MAG: 2-dehydro-3-deoxy-6-phosphogalactonate aldolase [Lentisphaeria bacterium]|nr:2-dehydro-3-deoxy-6-phosphogalactonate aldolase [Lentisphaeria bacterium]
MNFSDLLGKHPLIAILRGITAEEVPSVCDALDENGIKLLEIPLNTPNAFACIECAVRHTGGRQLTGAGTVLTPEDVERVHAAGGKFIISPNTDAAVIRRTKELDMISIPGFLTPSEGFTAMAAGADYLKLFPAGAMGTGYVRDIRAVIKKPILAVGGIGSENLADFMKVCIGAGIGSALYKPGKSLEDIRKAARELAAKL